MTGFTNFIRWCLRSPANEWKLQHAGRADGERLKVKVTAAAGGRDQIELKIKYPTCQQQRASMTYTMECFLFFPKELEAVRLSGFYSDLWEVVRLHKPQVSLVNLANKAGEGNLLGQIDTLLKEIRVGGRQGQEGRTRSAVYQMRLQACMMRRAIRKAAKKIHSQILDAGADRGSMLIAAAAMIPDFVMNVCHVMDALQEVCCICDGRGIPQDLVESWALCEEWLLVEAERALLRLIRDLDTCLPASRCGSDSGPERLGGWQISAVKLGGSQDPDGEDGAGRKKSEGGWESSREAAEGVAWGDPGLSHRPPDPATARAKLQHAALHFQNARRQKGYTESLIKIGDPFGNEHYTHRIKVLKRHAQEAISLLPKVKQRSQILNDVVGALVAALAMIVAVFGLWVGYRLAHYQLDIKFALITVLFYSIKDRIKKWGERYLEPVASWFGCSFPDRIVQLVDEQGSVVGKCDETCKTLDASGVDKAVRDMRWQEYQATMQRDQAALPERVLHLSKSMMVDWRALTPPLRDGIGLDDIMRIDLRHFCRRMEPASEPQFCMRQGPDGNFTVDKLSCARVYHVNLVVRIKQHPSSRGSGAVEAETSMQLDRTRLVLDQGGLLRLENMGLSVHKIWTDGGRWMIALSMEWQREMSSKVPAIAVPAALLHTEVRCTPAIQAVKCCPRTDALPQEETHARNVVRSTAMPSKLKSEAWLPPPL